MNVKVLGPGCANCKATVSVIEHVAKAKGLDVTIEKVEDLRDIISYGVMATPAVVVDGQVVHVGGRPSQAKVEQFLGA